MKKSLDEAPIPHWAIKSISQIRNINILSHREIFFLAVAVTATGAKEIRRFTFILISTVLYFSPFVTALLFTRSCTSCARAVILQQCARSLSDRKSHICGFFLFFLLREVAQDRGQERAKKVWNPSERCLAWIKCDAVRAARDSRDKSAIFLSAVNLLSFAKMLQGARKEHRRMTRQQIQFG